ncbi:DUF305 domain-containing protein [Streptomyces sp. NPDC057620]|uniref:DUF305 domain-containing protein n=1 Tax=Streptomyces sp. NPDC057620 TaxID=3346185 RepID=UPI0036901FF1
MICKRSIVRRMTAVGVASAAALVLAACGGDGGSADSSKHNGHGAGAGSSSASASPTTAQGKHNAADVAFAQGMIPHHRQAVEMADLAEGRARSAEVKKLAADIKRAQAPEIKTLSGWLTSWGEDVPAEGGMDHSTHDTGAMMTAEEMTELENASGTAFDTAFLKMMIKHHEGAVAMAKTEQADGASAAAVKLAGLIITAQSTEIDQMNTLLRKN